MTNQILYGPPHKFTRQQYAWRLGVSEALVENDWMGHPDFDMWKNRYANLITGLSEDKVRFFSSVTKEKRLSLMRIMMEQGADFDRLNILGFEL